jgi:hypothetical protein
VTFQIKQRKSKMNNKRTTYADRVYDSKFEAKVAYDLDLLKRAGNIKDFETQYRVDMIAYSECKSRSLRLSHKVDFRLHNNDGTYTLLEAKGLETADYKMRAKWLRTFWLPANPDHNYIVVYPSSRREAWQRLITENQS